MITPLSHDAEIRAAAEELRTLVAVYRAEAKTNPSLTTGYAMSVINGLGGAAGELAAAFTPEVAEEIATLMEHRIVARACPLLYPCGILRLAAQINGRVYVLFDWPE